MHVAIEEQPSVSPPAEDRPIPDNVMSPALDRVLDRERARADRIGLPLSLLQFVPSGDLSGRPERVRLAQAAAARVRVTDDMAWSADQRLYVVLPHTDAEGARLVAKDIVTEAGAAAAHFTLHLYRYPTGVTERSTPNDPPSTGGREMGEGLGLPEAEVRRLEAVFGKRLPLWKRAVDIAGAAFGLAIFSPILLAAAIAVRVSSPGPAIFRQRRSGLGGAPFTIYKFRTMVIDAERFQEQLKPLSEQDGPAFKLRNDPRITRVGRFLRNTSIDELPQFWNVLKGDMSLVGPRPLPCNQAEECDPWHNRRLDVTPGLTCTWQATARSQVTFDEWARMDARYARRRTFIGDAAILLRTIPAVLFGRGAK